MQNTQQTVHLSKQRKARYFATHGDAYADDHKYIPSQASTKEALALEHDHKSVIAAAVKVSDSTAQPMYRSLYLF